MDINRRDFLVAGALGLAAAGLPRVARGACGAGSCCAGSFKTVLKKALIRPRLTPEVVKVLKDNGYPGVELQDKKVSEAEARAARRLAEDEGVRIHSFMGGWFEFNAKDPAKRREAIETAKKNIRIAAAYGAPVILIVPARARGGRRLPRIRAGAERRDEVRAGRRVGARAARGGARRRHRSRERVEQPVGEARLRRGVHPLVQGRDREGLPRPPATTSATRRPQSGSTP